MPTRKKTADPSPLSNDLNIHNDQTAFAKSLEKAAEICAKNGVSFSVTIYNLYQQGGNAITNNYYGTKSDFSADESMDVEESMS